MRDGRYLKKLRERGKASRVYRKYQLDGLEVANMLHDERHKTLYIKLAKEMGGDAVRRIAKEVADNKKVKKPGAYFMAIVSRLKMQPDERTHLRTGKPKGKTGVASAHRTIRLRGTARAKGKGARLHEEGTE